MNGLKIVFLDLDGVLNTLRWRQKMGKKAIADEYGYSFDLIRILLRTLRGLSINPMLTLSYLHHGNAWDLTTFRACGKIDNFLAMSLTLPQVRRTGM